MFFLVLTMNNHRFTVPESSNPQYPYLGTLRSRRTCLVSNVQVKKKNKQRNYSCGIYINLKHAKTFWCVATTTCVNACIFHPLELWTLISLHKMHCESEMLPCNQMTHVIRPPDLRKYHLLLLYYKTCQEYNLILSRQSLLLALTNQNAKHAQARCHRNRAQWWKIRGRRIHCANKLLLGL